MGKKLTVDPSHQSGQSKPYNGFVAVVEQCKLRMSQPIRQLTFWQYMFLFVLCCGLPIGIEAAKYWFPPVGTMVQPSLENLVLALVTVFFSIAIPSALDLIFGRNKLLLNVGVFSAFVSIVLLVLIFFANLPHPLAVLLGAIGCVGAVLVWWVDRGLDEIFQDGTDPEDAVGGDPKKPLAERTTTIRT